MARDYIDFEEYDGDDIDANGHWFGLEYTVGLSDAADVQLAKVMGFINSFPKQGVRANVLLAALQPLMPLARKVANLSDGANKRSITQKIFGSSGTGYLTGPTVTKDDKTTAGRIIYEVEQRLPTLGNAVVDQALYSQIKTTAHQLLKIGTDLGDDVGAVIDNVYRVLESYAEAVVELPGTVGKFAKGIQESLPSTWDLIPTWVKIAVPATLAIGGLALYSILKAAAPYAGGYVAQKTGMHGLEGIGELRRHGKRQIVCFKARKSRRSRRKSEICFPVRHKR